MLIVLIIFFTILFKLLKRKENFSIQKRYYHWERKKGGWKELNIDKNYNEMFSARIENLFIDNLDNKDQLCSFLKGSQLQPECHILNDTKLDLSNDLWFLKKNNTGRGLDVHPLLGKDVYNKYNDIKKDNDIYLIQKGIDPYLHNGKKIDGRGLYLIVLHNNELSFYLYKDMFFKSAINTYNKDSLDINTQLTNNSLNKSKSQDILLSEFDKTIQNNIYDFFKDLSIKLKENIPKKSEHILEYQLCGPDIIIDKNKKPYIIEMNSKTPAYISSKNSKKVIKIKKEAKKGIEDMIVNLLNNKPSQLEENGFIKLI